MSYVSDAYCMISALQPQEFITTRIIKLQPGTTQNTCCSVVGSTIDFTDKTGKFLSRINPTRMPPTWRGNNCGVGSGAYSPTSSFRASDDPKSFEIYPPVPATGSYYAKIRCTRPPEELSITRLDQELPACKFTAAVTEWALYRALSGENDTALGNLAGLHYKAWQDIMGQQSKVAKAFAKGDM